MNETTSAYIAGFLDGDGSIMLQIRPREDVRYGYRLYSCIVLYQDTSHRAELEWMRDQLQAGYISVRNDGISELRLDGYHRVRQVLERLEPYIRFKREQVKLMLDALEITAELETAEQFLAACQIADRLSNANYSSRRKYTAQAVEEHLRSSGFLSP